MGDLVDMLTAFFAPLPIQAPNLPMTTVQQTNAFPNASSLSNPPAHVPQQVRNKTPNATMHSPPSPESSFHTPQQSPSPTANDTTLDEFEIWPDGDVVYEIPSSKLHENGNPHFGWALSHYNTTTENKNGETVKHRCCKGVMVCPSEECRFCVKPIGFSPVGLKGRPRRMNARCPVHKKDLTWIPCTGGPKTSRWKELYNPPCQVVTKFHPATPGVIAVEHKGSHNHPRPADNRPTPSARRQLEELVKANPELGPVQLQVGGITRLPLPKVHPSLNNKDRVGYLRKKILGRHSIGKGMEGFVQYLKNLRQNNDFTTKLGEDLDEFSITIQSEHMKNILDGMEGGLQTDTLEGAIKNKEYDGAIDIHLTTGYDKELDRWVPVLATIMFGRSARQYKNHWMEILKSFAHAPDSFTVHQNIPWRHNGLVFQFG